MYLDYFGLHGQPFGVTPDPAFLYLSQTHREALEALRSDLAADRGFMALVGEPGLGKTTLLYQLMEEWRQASRVVFLFQTQCDSRDFFRYLLGELDVDAESMGIVAMHRKLNDILFQEMLAGRRFVLIVDEAQNLDDPVLETVRGLSNFETQHAKLLNIVLAGQSQLADKLAAPGLRQLRQRIGPLNRLRPLTAFETSEYINHRLSLAGHSGEPIFTLGATQAIARASHGAPREINHICDQALRAAADEHLRAINLDMAQKAIAKIEGRGIKEKPLPVKALDAVPAPVSAEAPTPTPTPTPTSTFASGSSMRSAPRLNAPFAYEAPRKSRSKLWDIAGLASCILLLVVGVTFLVPPVRQYARQRYENFISRIPGGLPPAASSSPESSSEGTLPAYAPTSQENQSGQAMTVAPRLAGDGTGAPASAAPENAEERR